MLVTCREVAPILAEHHYLGPLSRGIAWRDEAGVIVVGTPTGRGVPKEWLELSRWCLLGRVPNAGSQQWSRFIVALRQISAATTIVSYSDPSQGHTGALYRACNWWWAPTWLRLRPPPSGNGSWTKGQQQSVKDRWVFPLQSDPRRVQILTAQDDSVLKKWPWARYREAGGVPFKRFLEVTAAARLGAENERD